MAPKKKITTLDEAEELQKQIAPELYQEEPPVEPILKEELPVVEPPVEPVVELVEEPPVEPTPPAKEEVDLATKVKELEAKLDKEESARARLSDRDKKLNVAQERIDRLEKELVLIKETAEKSKPPVVDAIRAKLIEKYGEDAEAIIMYDTLKSDLKTLEAKLGSEVTALKGTINETGQRVVNSAETVFLAQLAGEVEDWQTVRDDPKFGEWLVANKESSYSKRTIYDALIEASSEQDVERTSAIYKAFKETLAPSGNPPPPLKKDKEKLLAPPATPRGEVITKEPIFLTPGELKSKTDEIARLRSANRHTEADSLAKEIDSFLNNLGNLVT